MVGGLLCGGMEPVADPWRIWPPSAVALAGLERAHPSPKRREAGPGARLSRSIRCSLGAASRRCYQVPPVLQPPLPAVVQVRV